MFSDYPGQEYEGDIGYVFFAVAMAVGCLIWWAVKDPLAMNYSIWLWLVGNLIFWICATVLFHLISAVRGGRNNRSR